MSARKVDIAREAWGEAVPDWVIVLAQACDATSQSRVADRIGRSSSLVSGVCANTYKGDLEAVEDLVRGVFMGSEVACPVLGPLPTHVCREWRVRSRAFSNVNTQRVRMFRACNRCPRNQKSEGDHGDDD